MASPFRGAAASPPPDSVVAGARGQTADGAARATTSRRCGPRSPAPRRGSAYLTPLDESSAAACIGLRTALKQLATERSHAGVQRQPCDASQPERVAIRLCRQARLTAACVSAGSRWISSVSLLLKLKTTASDERQRRDRLHAAEPLLPPPPPLSTRPGPAMLRPAAPQAATAASGRGAAIAAGASGRRPVRHLRARGLQLRARSGRQRRWFQLGVAKPSRQVTCSAAKQR